MDYYNLDVIISVGYRVKSLRGTQFRIWANSVRKEYLIKGFAMNDELLKKAGGGNYFDELLERIRDIRSSEKVFWRKVLDIYATSMDYDPRIEASVLFFKTVQNKMHWAAHLVLDRPLPRKFISVRTVPNPIWGCTLSAEVIQHRQMF